MATPRDWNFNYVDQGRYGWNGNRRADIVIGNDAKIIISGLITSCPLTSQSPEND